MKKLLTKKIYNAIKKTLKQKKKYFLHEPYFDKKEQVSLSLALKNKKVSTYGETVRIFESRIRKFTKSKHAFATINGTSALHLSLFVLGVDQNCEVLIPSLNFIASTNATLYLKASPHFIDVEPDTLGPDSQKLDGYLKKIAFIKNGYCYNKKTNKIIKALVVTHVFGHPCKINEIKKLCNKYNIFLIEDAAEGLGSYYKNKHVGNFGLIGVLSFNGNKIITTGGGGAIITNSTKLANKINKFYTNSKILHKWEYKFSQIGYNYKMPALNAQLGIAQLKKIDFFLKKKRKLYKRYLINFKKIKEINLFKEPKYCKSNYWLQALVLKKPSLTTRNLILNLTNKNNIQTRPIWQSLFKNKHLKKYQRMDLSNSIDLEKRIINLPSGASE